MDTTKSFLVFGVSENTNNPMDGQVSGQITNGTTVTFQRAGTTGAVTVKWYVAEFSSGVSVQRGSVDLAATTPPWNVTLSAVDTSKSFPIVSYRVNGTDFDQNDFVRAKITSGTNLQLSATCSCPASPQILEWQVVEYQDARVQTGDSTSTAGNGSVAAPLTAVNIAKSWLLYSYECDAGGCPGPDPNIGNKLLRGTITSTTTLNFDRSNTGKGIVLTWYLVEFTDSTTVESGSQSFLSADTQKNVALSPGVVPGSSIAAGGDYLRGGRSPYSTDDLPGVSWFTLDVTASNNLRISRGAGGLAAADIGWFVVTFACDCQPLTTTEGAGTITVTARGSFEMTFDATTGGGIRAFYDLGEDPSRTYDLAGGTGAGKALYGDGIGVGANTYNVNVNDSGVKLDILEATPARVRVRQEAFYQQEPGTALLPGVKGFGDYSIYPAGRLALRWNQRTTSAVSYVFDDLDFVVHLQSSGALSNWTPYREAGAGFPGVGNDDFLLAQIEVAGARTDFLDIMYEDWTTGNGNPGTADTTDWFPEPTPNERGNPFWGQENTGATIPAPTGPYSTQVWPGVWNFLTYFKPTNFTNRTDAAVTSRRTDYRGPSALSILVGGPWQLASENTGGGDDFNESEGAYLATVDPANGLKFRIDGSAAVPRYKPFVKIRQWRSLAGPTSVTLQGTPPIANADYTAAVKPVSRAHFADRILFHTTLESFAAVTAPDIGDGTGSTQNTVNYVAARYGAGAQYDSTADRITVPLVVGATQNVELDRGRIEFWYRPNYSPDDDVQHYIFDIYGGAGVGRVRMKKESVASGGAQPNRLSVDVTDSSGVVHNAFITTANYNWNAGDWVHLAMEWDSTAATDNVRAYLNGVRLTPGVVSNGTFPMGAETGVSMVIGNSNPFFGNFDGGGILDELTVYDAPASPTSLADGGLASNSNEYLGDLTRNFTVSFNGVDAARRGKYLFLGADSQFRGLNVALATPGAGVAVGDLDWEYWDGTAWANLESVGGFTDQTNSFTGTGSLFWGDPPTWSPYSVNGGPDLYYVRAHLKNGATYGTPPVESAIKTDILLFQYCGDITASAQEFVFAAPVPTAVVLSSFEARALDHSVELSWKTASELHNLGFHLYRSLSAGGPYERITDTAIPGLGSSPSGGNYTYLDSGLVNGRTYFYELEDIETTGKTQRHGPVSATPTASARAMGSSDPSIPPVELTDAESSPSPMGFRLRIVDRNSRHRILELETPGFTAEPRPDGSTGLSIPGFSADSPPGAPAVPLLRKWVKVKSGVGVRIASVRAEDVKVFSSLRPTAAESPELVATRWGTVVPGRRARREGASFRGAGLYPEEAARLIEVGFQGDTKKVLLELAPLRWNRTTGEVVLARRLVVNLAFTGREAARRRTRPGGDKRVVVLRLSTRERGLYGVSFEKLFGRGGRARGVRADTLRLSRLGKPVAIHVEPDNPVFGPGSKLFFLSKGASANPYGDEAVYELELDGGGTTMPVVAAPRSGNSLSISIAWQNVGREENRYYQAGLLEAQDPWLWDLLFAPVTKSYSFEVTALASTPEPSRVSVWLQGVSDLEASPDHHLRLSVNGVFVAESMLEGKAPLKMTAEIPGGVLKEGPNVLEIENAGDTGAAYSMVMLDRFEVSYPRKLVATDGVFEASFRESGVAEVQDLPAGSFALDTSEEPPRWLTIGPRFSVEAGRSYRVQSPKAVLEPGVTGTKRTVLENAGNQADYLVIGPREFLDTVQPLLELRRSQGLRSQAIPIEDVYSTFGFGETRPEAIREFLSYANHLWQKPSPRYVLLLGDATYDFKDYLRTGVKNEVPSWIVRTTYLWTASDSAYAAVNGDDVLPDLALGRLPAASADEARAMVEKILSYESSGTITRGPFVLVADNADEAGNFEAHADEIAATMLADRDPRKIYLSRLGAEAARREVVEAFDDGAGLLSYLGHGGIQLWAQEDMFDTDDVRGLAPQSRTPLLMTMNCLNGYFDFPYFDSLAEARVKAKGRGAVAAFSPSGLSLDEPAHLYQGLLLREILSKKYRRLGDAILAAQSAYADSGAFPDLLRIYLLLGDPALTLR